MKAHDSLTPKALELPPAALALGLETAFVTLTPPFLAST